MKMLSTTGILALTLSLPSSAQAFFEEGNDATFHVGYTKCNEEGNLLQADSTGCNPWPDADSSYSYKQFRDMKKNSLHFNATAALAVAAGFDRCAALLIGAYDEATDVATEYDLELWVPYLDGMDPAACEALVVEENAEVVDGLVKPGFLVAPDFTFRSFSKGQDNEVVRESYTFHWNHTLATLDVDPGVECSVTNGDPLPVPPKTDMVSLGGLLAWTRGENTLNPCSYDVSLGAFGPIVDYHPDFDVAPGSLGSMGVFLHALQDAYSHRACGGTTHNFGGATDSPCGFASGHYAGDFGTLADGTIGSGKISVVTPARKRGYPVELHSDQSKLALQHTYEVLKDYLYNNPRYGRGVEPCSVDAISAFAAQFVSIPNVVPASGDASGAKKRSDLADALFRSETCSAN